MADLVSKPTLVMGARGSVGRHVLDELLRRGPPVRASARHPKPDQFPESVDVCAADLTDPSSLLPAFDGMGQVFRYASHGSADGVVDAARACGVGRIVLLSSGSVIHPPSRGNPIAEGHREIEESFVSADGIAVIPVRPLVLAGNALAWAHPIRSAGTVALYQPEAMTAPIHERDIAAVAVKALTGNDDTTGMLTGPVLLTQRAQVAAIGAATGRNIPVTALGRKDALAQFSRFMPTEEAEAVLRFLDDAAAGNSPATGTAEQILGLPGAPFDVWAADHAADFA